MPDNNSLVTTDRYYAGTGRNPANGRVTTVLEDGQNLAGHLFDGGMLKSAFNSASGFMDEHPVFTKWATFGLAMVGMMQVGDKLNLMTMFGDNIFGKTLSILLFGGMMAYAASGVADWASNKGADSRAGATGLLPQTAPPQAQGGDSRTTTGSFNRNASQDQPPPAPREETPSAGRRAADPLPGLDSILSGPG